MAKQTITVNIGGIDVIFDIYIEKRKSVRLAFGKSTIIVRIPSFLSRKEQDIHFKKGVEWVKRKAKNNLSILDKYILKDYDEQTHFLIYGRRINMDIGYGMRVTGSAKYDKYTESIDLVLPIDIEGNDKNKMIVTLLSRVCAKIFKPDIERKVAEFNEKWFNKDIKSVNLKYNTSNWGSCSSKNNINLSTRLLFAPMDVIDYVIIHELTHLIEMNHSKKFWDIVQKVMPDYKEKEAWLDANSSSCYF
ncbi:MAG: M48 family metallopeptidase [Saprospiraceae bacterium]